MLVNWDLFTSYEWENMVISLTMMNMASYYESMSYMCEIQVMNALAIDISQLLLRLGNLISNRDWWISTLECIAPDWYTSA